ncbi:MAG: helix-turn-helix domain-containing protein [Thermoplasmata archaeon]|nr:helix-turn-helix domain-containing protein [Thermoplasmata archaeon]
MRAVTIEIATDVLVTLGIVPARFFDRYEEVELMETLRLEQGWRLQLLRVRSRRALRSLRELERDSREIRHRYGLQSLEVVERRPRTREWIVLVRQKNPEFIERLITSSGGGIAPVAPFRIDADRTVASFRGEPGPIRRALKRLEREELPFRILRSSAHPYSAARAVASLTPKQAVAIARAWTLGYYAVPRRITLTRLSKLSGQSPPALGKMLRRAEGRLVTRFLSEEEGAAASDRAQGSLASRSAES